MRQKIIFIFLLCIFSFIPIMSASAEISTANLGPIDLQAYMRETLNLSTSAWGEANESAEYNLDSRVAKMFATVLSSKWLITRIMIFGFSNYDGAIAMMNDTSALQKELDNRDKQKAQAVTAAIKNNTAEKVDVVVNDFYNSSWKNVAKQKEIMSQYQYVVKNFETLKGMPGSTTSTSIYMRVSYIGILLLFITFIVRLIMMMWRNFQGTDGINSGMPEVMEAFIRLVVLIIFIYMFKWFVMFLLLFSEMLRNAIMGINSASQASDLAETLTKMSQLKGDMVGMEHNYSLAGWGVHSLYSLLTNSISYICYVITGAIIYVMVLLGDIMLGITAVLSPLIIAMGMIKGFERWVEHLFTSVVTFALYMPIAALYMLVMVMIHSMMPSVSFLAFLTISYAFFFAATKIPNIAETLSTAGMATLVTASAGKICSYMAGAGLFSVKSAAQSRGKHES